MKKLLTSIFVLAILACSVCSCSNSENSSSSDSDSVSDTENSEETPEEPTNAPNDTKLSEEIIKPLKDYFISYQNIDADLYLEAVNPKFCLDWAKETGVYNEAVMSAKDSIESSILIWQNNYGDDVTREFIEEIQNTTLTPEQLGYAEMMFRYDYYGIDVDFEITEGYEVTFTYMLKGEKDEKVDEQAACLINIKDEGWILLEQDAASLTDYKDVPPPEEVAQQIQTTESETSVE